MDFDPAEESTFCFHNTEEEHGDGDTNGCVYSVLNAREDRNKDACKENEYFQG